MANFDSRTYCNTFWMISGTSKNSTTYMDPRTPYLSPKYCNKREKMGTCLQILSLHIWEYEIVIFLGGLCTYLLHVSFLFFWSFQLLYFAIWNFEKSKRDYSNIGNLKIKSSEKINLEIINSQMEEFQIETIKFKIQNWKVQTCTLGTWKFPNSKIENWEI